MAINVLKTPKKPRKSIQFNSRVLNWLGRWFKVEKWIGGRAFPVRYLDATLYVLGLAIIIMFFRIHAERQMRQIHRLSEEVNNLRASYTILKAHYMKMGKQSELAPKVAKMGLKESRQTPQRIVVKHDEIQK